MKDRLKCIIVPFLFLMSGMAYSQNTALLDKLYDYLASGHITLDISYVIDIESTEVMGEGVVSFQGDAYHMVGNGLEVYCDGVDVWMIDSYAKEVYIEPVDDGPDAFLQNPALLFSGLKDNFKVSGVLPAASGETIFEMTPIVSCGIDDCSVRIKEDGRLTYGSFAMSEGQIVKVTVNAINKTDRKDISAFSPSIQYDSSWMITDFR